MCRDRVQIGTEINAAARGLEEEMEPGSGGKSQHDAGFPDEAHSPQTTTGRHLQVSLLDVGSVASGQHDGAQAAEIGFWGMGFMRAPRGVKAAARGWLDPKPNTLPPLTEKSPRPHLIDLIASNDAHAPFTDSGYASGPIETKTAVARSRHPLQIPGDPNDSNIAAHRSIIDEDAETLYSAATSLDPFCSRRYIEELSKDLYRNLQAQLNLPDWVSVSQAFPDLIKTFAAKIGQGGDSQVHLEIMYFIHKRHRWVVSEHDSRALHLRPELTDTTSQRHHPPS
jgi:hypothetical protein